MVGSKIRDQVPIPDMRNDDEIYNAKLVKMVFKAYGRTNLSIVTCVGWCWGQTHKLEGLRCGRKGERAVVHGVELAMEGARASGQGSRSSSRCSLAFQGLQTIQWQAVGGERRGVPSS
jgi:hypothetical protein